MTLSGTLSGTPGISGTLWTLSGILLHGFSTPAGIGVEELEALLASTGLRPDATTLVRRTYYDTFDARLYRAGWVLEHERLLHADGSPAAGPDGGWLRLRPLQAAQAVIEQPASTVPRRADDLADERLRGRVAELAGGRALLAQLEGAPSRERLFRCLGPEEKTVARVVVASDLPGGDAADDLTAGGWRTGGRPSGRWRCAATTTSSPRSPGRSATCSATVGPPIRTSPPATPRAGRRASIRPPSTWCSIPGRPRTGDPGADRAAHGGGRRQRARRAGRPRRRVPARLPGRHPAGPLPAQRRPRRVARGSAPVAGG